MKRSAAIFSFLLCLALTPFTAWAEPAIAIIGHTTDYGTISYPVISGLANERAEQRINHAISRIVSAWTCDDNDPNPEELRLKYLSENRKNFSFNAASTVRLIDSHFFSFTTKTNYYCGGPHPGESYDGYTFDINSGKLISLNDLLAPELQGEALTKFLVTGHKFVNSCMDETGKNDMADTYDPETFPNEYWGFYRTSGSIVFIPPLPHAVWACLEEFPVSLEALKPYLRQ